MTSRADLEGLLARVDGATGGDREVDGLLEIAFTFGGNSGYEHVRGRFYVPGRRVVAVHEAPPYTSSLDAAIALVERVLPGATWSVYRDPKITGSEDRACWAYVDVGQASVGSGDIATPALATIAALLRALLKALSAQSASPAERSDRAQDEQSNGKVE